MRCAYDVIVVGGGPAGASTALYAARHGLRVLLLDKKSFPRDKICGDLLPPPAARLLHELHLLQPLLRRLHHRNGHLVAYTGRQRRRLSETPLIMTRRFLLDDVLFRAARAAVETREGWKVEDLLLENGRVCGVRGVSDEGTPFACIARVVVGADGYGSVVARKAGLYQHAPRYRAVATRAYYRNARFSGDELEIHYFPELTPSPGYLWIFPVDADTVNVGVIVPIETLKKSPHTLRALHAHLLHTTPLGARFEDAELMGSVQGWNLPLADLCRPLHGQGVVLVGDAAGLVNTTFGHGIDTAMLSGKLAAAHLARVCADGGTAEAAQLQPYTEALWRQIRTLWGRSSPSSQAVAVC